MADSQKPKKINVETGTVSKQGEAEPKTKRAHHHRIYRSRQRASSTEFKKNSDSQPHVNEKDFSEKPSNGQKDPKNKQCSDVKLLAHGTSHYEKYGARPKCSSGSELPKDGSQSVSTKSKRTRRRPRKNNKSERSQEMHNSSCYGGEDDKNFTKEPLQVKHENLRSEETNKITNLSLKKGKEQNENNPEGKQKRKPRAKVTDMFIVFEETFPGNRDFTGFLKHRMGNPKLIDFEVIGLLDTGMEQGTILKVRFKSFQKSSAARHLLNSSNRNASSKVQCYYDSCEAIGKLKDSDGIKETKLDAAFTEIVNKVSKMLEKHNQKMINAEKQFECVQKQLSSRHGVSLDIFEKLSNEKEACTDKLKELQGQKNQFLNYVSNMNDKLKDLITHKKFDNELKEIRKSFGVECQRLVSALPIYSRREDILSTIKDNQVCVILGETGSGKSTQIAQYIYEAGFAANGLIACTQPRKIAAISLATKVSSELASNVGQIVGYKVGMQSKTTAVTKVLYMNDHILLNECLSDQDLMKYSCIVIDEAHERSIHTDLLIGMLKQCLERRPELHVIITSATIDTQLFVDYFGGNCPVLKVSGRMFPVDVIWNQNDYFESPFPEDYEQKALNKAVELHMSYPIDTGDILVFLTAAIETERCVERFKKRVGDKDILCLQMHGRLKAEEQQLVLAPTPAGKRKIVFATNNAETSITIPGITFVIDTGVVKEMVFDPKKNINSLNVVRISQSSANQRKGRAGRTRSGLCFRLYTEKDFDGMEKISKPEILRVRVSQAILKLMDFGIDPMEFEYVQPPSLDAMKSALDELVQIGAVINNGLSELGKWISKVPLEPRLGAFVKKGIDKDVLSEVLVVASCSSQNGLFFRVGTQEEKNRADMKKVKFCHIGGDLLTMLNVYREWDQINEKKKGKWCVDNCINGKSVKAVRDMVNEIIFVLKKEYNMQIKHAFGDPQTVDTQVQNLIFESMSTNLGYFLGHEQAGYMVTEKMVRVQLHPSSSIHSLGLRPTWIVFSKVLRTSNDFLTDVTIVPGECILEAIEDRRLNVDISSLELQKVQLSLKVSVGRHVFWKFVGSMHTNRQKVEDEISKSCQNSMIVIETNKQKGEIALFCVPKYEIIAKTLLQSILDEMPKQLRLEAREDAIGNERSGIRAVIRSGGTISDILMPHEFRSLMIKQKDERIEITEDRMHDILNSYGLIEQIWASKGKKQQYQCWGRVTFYHDVDAQAAVDYINDDEDSEIYTIPIRHKNQRSTNQKKQEFTMKLTWCRRQSKGHCFVHVSCPEDLASLSSKSFELDGHEIDVKLARNSIDLFLEGLGPEVLEEDIKEGLANLLDISRKDGMDRFRVVIPRHNVSWSENQKYDLQEMLSFLISDLTGTPENAFHVHVRDFQPKTVMCVAFITFSDPEVFQNTGKCLINKKARVNESDIHVSLECKSSIHVDKNLYPIVAQDLDDLINKQNRSSVSIEKKVLKSGALMLNINAASAKHLAKVKVHIDSVVGGDVLECENTDNLNMFFCTSGRQMAKRIEHSTKTLIYIDERNMKVTVQGLHKGRMEAITRINQFLSSYNNSVEKTARLKGDDMPAGLMKALLVKYGIGFENLLDETGCVRVKLNLRHHEITITGAEDDVSKALGKIKDIRNEIMSEPVEEFDAPDCPICFCPVDEHDISRLEYCGHAYCNVCLVSLIQNAVVNKEFPVQCAKEGCDQLLVVRDFNGMIKMGKLKPVALLDAALSCFIAKNQDKYRYCITPDCSMVYPVSSDGELFVCPLCQSKICTACHMLNHDGISCSMYKSAKRDGNSVVKWLSEDTENRKLCPKCNARIEKDGGCQHVHCTACNTHICWICMKHFDSNGKCYGHLNSAHGTFV